MIGFALRFDQPAGLPSGGTPMSSSRAQSEKAVEEVRLVEPLTTLTENVARLVEAKISATGGVLGLTPCWVPRVFLQPPAALEAASP